MYNDKTTYSRGPAAQTPEVQGAIRALLGVSAFFRAGIKSLGPLLGEHDVAVITNDIDYIERTAEQFRQKGAPAFEALEKSSTEENSMDSTQAAVLLALLFGPGLIGEAKNRDEGTLDGLGLKSREGDGGGLGPTTRNRGSKVVRDGGSPFREDFGR